MKNFWKVGQAGASTALDGTFCSGAVKARYVFQTNCISVDQLCLSKNFYFVTNTDLKTIVMLPVSRTSLGPKISVVKRSRRVSLRRGDSLNAFSIPVRGDFEGKLEKFFQRVRGSNLARCL